MILLFRLKWPKSRGTTFGNDAVGFQSGFIYKQTFTLTLNKINVLIVTLKVYETEDFLVTFTFLSDNTCKEISKSYKPCIYKNVSLAS